MRYYIFTRIPGQAERYSVAVLAISRSDAKTYMTRYWGGGTFAAQIDAGHVEADCGALTAAAEAVLRQRREAEDALEGCD